ncbi:hypothetical protein [Paraburkholderia panacisoli]|jgi:hypothetical protein|uniref:hypothetical protein n=1 Tax=Paraburkholderia panacisoli TaxID=2603818 RepID=UPI00165F50A7|nr:hypothetical protein [Paraburkholderia panacisoli]
MSGAVSDATNIAHARMDSDRARLLTLFIAWKIDTLGIKAVMTEFSAITLVALNVEGSR